MKKLLLALLATVGVGAHAANIDERALRPEQFSTNIPAPHYIGIIGYGVTNVPGTNIQFSSGTGITFTTNGAGVTITATGTNQTTITNIVVQAGTNIVVTTNAPLNWTINAVDLWQSNSVDLSITNINGTKGVLHVSSANAVMEADNRGTGTMILIGETNGLPLYVLRSDGSVFFGKTATNSAATTAFTTRYPLASQAYTLSNEPAVTFIDLFGADQVTPTFSAELGANVNANKDTAASQILLQSLTTNGLTRRWLMLAKPSLSELSLGTQTNTQFKVDDIGNLAIIKNVGYAWPATNGGSGQFLVTDGLLPQTLSWVDGPAAGTNAVAVAAGTNIVTTTNAGVVTVSVNNLTNTINSLITNQTPNFIHGTTNYIAKFTPNTNEVGDSIVSEPATNIWEWRSRKAGTAWTNGVTNIIYGQVTSPTVWNALEIAANPLSVSGVDQIHAIAGSGVSAYNPLLELNDSWGINSFTYDGGVGNMAPRHDNVSSFGSVGLRIKQGFSGPGGWTTTDTASWSGPAQYGSGSYGFVFTTGGIEIFKNSVGFMAQFQRSAVDLLFGLNIGTGVLGAGNPGVGTDAPWDTFLTRGNEAHTWNFTTNNATATKAPRPILESGIGVGTDKAGADMLIASGRGTGNGPPGNLFFATPRTNNASSSSIQTLVDRMQIDTNGNVTVYSNLTVNGTITGTVTGSQTPWTSDINGGGFQLTNVSSITAVGSGPSVFTTGISNKSYLVVEGNITNTSLTASRAVIASADTPPSLQSSAASGAVPMDANGTATTFAQVSALAPGYAVTNGNANVFTQSNTFNVDWTHQFNGNGAGITNVWTKGIISGNLGAAGLSAPPRWFPVSSSSGAAIGSVLASVQQAPTVGYISNFVVWNSVAFASTTNVVLTIQTNTFFTTPVNSSTVVTINAGSTSASDTTHSIACVPNMSWTIQVTNAANVALPSCSYAWSVEWWHQNGQ